MRLYDLPIGHAFEYELGKAVKLLDTSDFSKVMPCLLFGIMKFKQLVIPISKIESFFIKKDIERKLEPARKQEWGTIIKTPHNDPNYLITSGVSMSGVIVVKLGKELILDPTTAVNDLGYAANHIGLNEL